MLDEWESSTIGRVLSMNQQGQWRGWRPKTGSREQCVSNAALVKDHKGCGEKYQ